MGPYLICGLYIQLLIVVCLQIDGERVSDRARDFFKHPAIGIEGADNSIRVTGLQQFNEPSDGHGCGPLLTERQGGAGGCGGVLIGGVMFYLDKRLFKTLDLVAKALNKLSGLLFC